MGVAFLREARWLGPERVRVYLWVFAIVNMATLIILLATSHAGVDRNGFLLGTDFLSFWTAGRMLHTGANLYDAVAHIAAQQTFYRQESSYTAFFYPPPFLPICYPLGFLSYFPALVAWLTVTGAVFLAVARLWLRKVGIDRPLLLLAAAFPPVLITVTHGQTSFLVAALLGLGALSVRERPTVAGICFGLATIKPQFGILVPFVLLATGEWRVIAAAVASAVVFALLTTFAFGAEVWPHWLAVSRAAEAAMDQGAVGFGKMQSAFAAARLLGAPIDIAYGQQALVTLGVVGSVAWAGWRTGYTFALASAMLAGSLLVTPFVLDYDTILLAFPLVWLAGSGFRPWEKITALLAFVAPAVARPLALQADLPIMPLVLIALFIVLVRRAVAEREDSSRADSMLGKASAAA
jgi:hypothetical protein